MAMRAEILAAMNDHINLEIYSAYLYLSMALQMEDLNYKGYAKFLEKHFDEELTHAKDFIGFVQKRNARPELEDVKAEPCNVTEPLELARIVLAHEQKVTDSITRLHELAVESKDYPTQIFLQDYIKEQTEEEDLALSIIDKFTFAGTSTSAKYAVDRELLSL